MRWVTLFGLAGVALGSCPQGRAGTKDSVQGPVQRTPATEEYRGRELGPVQRTPALDPATAGAAADRGFQLPRRQPPPTLPHAKGAPCA